MEQKFIIFKLNEDLFAIELKMAREIIKTTHIKPIPNMPHFFSGVIHLRGFLLPVIDLKKLLQIPFTKEEISKNKIIILSWQRKIFGLLVDEIEDIITIDEEKIIPAPALITSMDINFFKGGFYINESIILITDLDMILSKHLKQISKEKKLDNYLSRM